jgi:hypothetical protein
MTNTFSSKQRISEQLLDESFMSKELSRASNFDKILSFTSKSSGDNGYHVEVASNFNHNGRDSRHYVQKCIRKPIQDNMGDSEKNAAAAVADTSHANTMGGSDLEKRATISKETIEKASTTAEDEVDCSAPSDSKDDDEGESREETKGDQKPSTAQKPKKRKPKGYVPMSFPQRVSLRREQASQVAGCAGYVCAAHKIPPSLSVSAPLCQPFGQENDSNAGISLKKTNLALSASFRLNS